MILVIETLLDLHQQQQLLILNHIQMTTFKQINFKRDYETTNIKFIQVLDNEVLNTNVWEQCDESEINCNQLWKEGNKIMFGYL